MDVQLGHRGQLRILIRSIQDSSYAQQIHTSSLSPNPRTRDPAFDTSYLPHDRPNTTLVRYLRERIITNLSAETIEMLELLRYWWINSIVTQGRGGTGLKTRSFRPRNPLYRPDNGDEDTGGLSE
jgi:hypothetical protein